MFCADGHEHCVIGVTGFKILQKWLDGDRSAVDAFTDWMIANGVGQVRALGMYSPYIGEFIPSRYPQYFDDLDGLLTYLSDRKLRLNLSCLADLSTNAPGRNILDLDPGFNYRQHFYSVADVCKDHWNVTLDLGNQFPKNGFDPDEFDKPAGVMCSRGSALEDQLSPLPPWDYFDYHPSRTDFSRKVKTPQEHRAADSVVVPQHWQEPIGVGEQTQGASTTDDALAYWRFAAGLRAFGVAMHTVHVRDGILPFVPPGPRASAVVKAAVQAVRDIPVSYSLGAYQRGEGDGSNGNLSIYHHDDIAARTYELTNGNTSIVIVCDPKPGWTLKVQHGTVVKSYSYQGETPSVFEMKR